MRVCTLQHQENSDSSCQSTWCSSSSKLLSFQDWTTAVLNWPALSASATKPLQMIQHAAARLVFNQPKRTHITPLLILLHWLKVAARIKYKALTLAFRTATGLTHPYFNALLQVTVIEWAALYERDKVPFQNFHNPCSSLVEWAANLNPIYWDHYNFHKAAGDTHLPHNFKPRKMSTSAFLYFIFVLACFLI